MSRPSIMSIFMETAKLFATRSTCKRVKVGAVLVKDGRIISTGYNGTPSGVIHCEDHFEHNEYNSNLHAEFSKKYELHAEQNVLAQALKNGVNIENSMLVQTLSPCSQCSKLILASGIKTVIYLEKYDRDVDGISFLLNNGVKCKQFDE